MRYDGPLEFSMAAVGPRNHCAAKVSRVSDTALGLFLTAPACCLPSWRGGNSYSSQNETDTAVLRP